MHLLRQALPADGNFGDVVALDTKHILAWVTENNPKASVRARYDKTKQPKGDPDCKLGCKKRHNQGAGDGGAAAETTATPTQPAVAPPSTPTTHPVPARQASVGEYYWGYASGVITTKVPDWGEFVLAELTQTFNHGDATYFFPLMAATERRLGRRPRYGALDKAYDAFYVYQYFHDAGGFAAVPFSEKGGRQSRSFSPEGLPLCAAGLAMPLKFTFTDRTSTLVVHERGKMSVRALSSHDGRRLSGQPRQLAQGRLHRHDADLCRRPYPLSARPRACRVQSHLQTAHRR